MSAEQIRSSLPVDVYFDDIEIGYSYLSPQRTITQDEIVQFANLTGDRTPIHIDAEFCRTRPYGRPIGHGAFALSLMIGLKSTLGLYANTSVAALGWDQVRYRNPFFGGDTLHARIRYASKRISRRNPSVGIVQEHVDLVKGAGQIVAEGEHFIMLEFRPGAATMAGPNPS